LADFSPASLDSIVTISTAIITKSDIILKKHFSKKRNKYAMLRLLIFALGKIFDDSNSF
jgi:hypothetical protein